MSKKYVGGKGLADLLAIKRNISKKEAEGIIKDLGQLIEEVLLDTNNDGIQLVDIITLEKVARAERMGRNPRTKEEILITARTGIKAKLGSKLDKKINPKK